LLCKERKAEREREREREREKERKRKREKEKERERIKKINLLSKFFRIKFHSKNRTIIELLKLK